MGIKDLDTKRDEPKIESYKIKTFTGRDFPKAYKNLVLANFMNSLRYGNDLFKLCEKEPYYKAYTIFIENLFQRPDLQVRIALLDEDTALGWCLYQGSTVHYVWVKKDQRRQGIGQSLLPKQFSTVSHITKRWLGIWANHYPDVRYNPFS